MRAGSCMCFVAPCDCAWTVLPPAATPVPVPAAPAPTTQAGLGFGQNLVVALVVGVLLRLLWK